jgi:hypothetical protein
MTAIRSATIMGASLLALVLTAGGHTLADPAGAATRTAGPALGAVPDRTAAAPSKHTKHKRHHRKRHHGAGGDSHAAPDAPLTPAAPGAQPPRGGSGPGNPGDVAPPPLPKAGTPSAPHGAAAPGVG